MYRNINSEKENLTDSRTIYGSPLIEALFVIFFDGGQATDFPKAETWAFGRCLG